MTPGVAQQPSGRESKHKRGCNRKSAQLATGRQPRYPRQAFENDLKARLDEYKTTDEGKDRVLRCVAELEEAVKTLGPKWRVKPFGSAANGFATRLSDLDVTCYDEPQDGSPHGEGASLESKEPAGILGKQLAPLLRKHRQFAVREEILCARIPILKLSFEGCLEVDLSCNNTDPLHNTRLLKAYADLDDRVRQLGIIVKLWAKANHVCGAFQSHLSSYSLTLMCLYFMQVHPKVRLPMLPVAVFGHGSEADAQDRCQAAYDAFKCSLSLGELFVRFLQFYSQEFYWGSEVVSLRLGSRLDVKEPFFSQLKARSADRLHVEDPVDLTRNLNCVLGESQEMRLRKALEEAHVCLTIGKALPMGYPSERNGVCSQQDKIDTKGQTASSISTVASSTEEGGVADRDDMEEVADGADQSQRKPVHVAIELEALLLGDRALQDSARRPDMVAAPLQAEKHALLELLHGSRGLQDKPEASQRARGESQTASTWPRQMSKASQSIAAKVAAACSQNTPR